MSSFVGRKQEIEQLYVLLATARLVTLTGPPGIGKTRLALEVAGKAARCYGNGGCFVDLTTASGGALVSRAVATALRVREDPSRAVVESLLGHLRARTLLLILDNCEHVINASARLAEELLQSCPGVHLLATSREALGVAGEHVVAVPPLSAPDTGPDLVPDLIATHEAVRLFVDRATERGFRVPPSSVATVAEICRRLDGIPLAIELAAARLEVLSPTQIAERLDERFRLLTGGLRTAPQRHQTLLSALNWSCDLLLSSERSLLHRLSVFVGGCTLEAAENVCTGTGVEQSDILSLVGQLVAKSLVVCDIAGEEARYRLLDTIRAYGRDEVAATGEAAGLRRAHAEWCLKLAGQAETELTRQNQAIWLSRLEAELPNLRAALEWSATEDPELGLKIASSLTLFWLVRGRLLEGREWLERLLDQREYSPLLRAFALWGSGFLAAMLGHFADARAAGERGLALFREIEDDRGIARCLNLLGVLAAHRNPCTSRPLLEESVERARAANDTWCLAESLGILGFAHVFQGDFVAASRPFHECLDVARREGNKQGLRMGLLGSGYVALQRADYRLAEALLGDGLDAAGQLGDPLWTAVAHVYCGELVAVGGDYAGAESHQRKALALVRETGSAFFLGFCLSFLGRTLLRSGAVVGSRELFEEALALPRTTGHKSNVALSLLGLSEALEAIGSREAASRALQEAHDVAVDSGDRLLISWVLDAQGRLASAQADWETARSLHCEALSVKLAIGHTSGLAQSLEVLAGVACDESRHDHAARLLAAADSFRLANGYARCPTEQRAWDAIVERATARLSPEEFRCAWDHGARVLLEDAVQHALRRQGSRKRQTVGWESLTRAERDVVRLVAQGLTNPEIGCRLFISRRTVQSHLSHIFAKLDLHSRLDLAREAQRRGI